MVCENSWRFLDVWQSSEYASGIGTIEARYHIEHTIKTGSTESVHITSFMPHEHLLYVKFRSHVFPVSQFKGKFS